MMEGSPLLVANPTVYFVLKFYFFICLLLHLGCCETSSLMAVLYQRDILMRHLWTKSAAVGVKGWIFRYCLWALANFLFPFLLTPNCLQFGLHCSSVCAVRSLLWRQNTKDLSFENFWQMEGGWEHTVSKKMLARPIWHVFLSSESIFCMFSKKNKNKQTKMLLFRFLFEHLLAVTGDADY